LATPEEGEEMARTNIDLDEQLVEERLRVFKCKTKKALIHLALQELLKTEKRQEILTLRGRLQWEGDLEETRRSRLTKGFVSLKSQTRFPSLLQARSCAAY
jgi:Arc/MetJ family transcription regulator